MSPRKRDRARSAAQRETRWAAAGEGGQTEPPGRRPPRPPHRPSSPARGRAYAALGLLIALAAAAWGWPAWREHRAKVAATRDPIASLTPAEAHDVAMRLAGAGKTVESFRYFRHAAAGRQSVPWHFHNDYSSALHNMATATRVRLGWAGPATRSSVERIALMREALREADRAESLATTGRERAFVISGRASSLETWGFHVEALSEFRRAVQEDSTWRDAQEGARRSLLLVQGRGRPAPQ